MSNQKKLSPVGNRVIITVDQKEEKTESGIILTQKKEDNRGKGTIQAVSYESAQKNLKVGDKVVYEPYAGTEVEIDDKKYLIIPVENLLAVIKEENNE